MKKTKLDFEFKGSDVLLGAWHSLSNKDRAELKRCHTLNDVVLHPAFWRTKFALINSDCTPGEEQLALTLAVISHVKPEDVSSSSGMSLATLMAQRNQGTNRPLISEARFQKLLRHNKRTTLFREILQCVRALPTDRIAFEAIVHPLWFWGDNQKKDWVRDYYTSMQRSEE